MKKYDTRNLRNVGIIGHGGCGKTSLGEAFLFNSKATTRLGSVDAKSSNLDSEPEEITRGGSVSAGFGMVEWKNCKVNIVDTPGDSNFVADTRSVMRGIDATLVVISAVDGVEVNTEMVWGLSEDQKLARAIYINKMDRERANFENTLADIQKTLEVKPVLFALPIGKEENFRGVVDVLKSKALIFANDASGKFTEEDIPADMKEQAEQAHHDLIESIAETNETLMEKYFEAETLSMEDLLGAIPGAVNSRQILPVLCGSATKNMGAQLVLDFIADFFPSPIDRPAIVATRPNTSDKVEIVASENEPFRALVFKTIADPFAGRLSVFRVYSGVLNSDSTFYNASIGQKERFGSILLLNGKKQDTVDMVGAGDIAALPKLKETQTGHSLAADEKNAVLLPPLTPPQPFVTYAVKPKSKGDEDKIMTSLQRLMEEDMSLQLGRDEQTKDILLSGMGPVHIETTLKKLKRKFNVEVELHLPKVPYRETIKKTAQAQGRHKKQSGGRGQFGDCWIEMSPLPRGEMYEFVDDVFGGSVPRQFIPAVDKGIQDSLGKGPLAGFPVVDIKVRLYDGSYHAVDSDEMSFRMAGSLAFKAAYEKCEPILLEPVMQMEVVVPEESLGDIMGDIISRRGRVLGMESRGKNQVIMAHVPMAEVLEYAASLRSMTGGRGAFTMQLDHYEEVPNHLVDKIIAEEKAARE